MKIKRFSKIGRFGSGLKKAIKYGAKGALYGGIAAPVLTLGIGWKKTAPAGALIGAGIGSKLGWDEGVSSYDHQEKMKNDPGYKEKYEKERRDTILKNIKQSEAEDLGYLSYFDYNSWSKIKEAPKDFLKYVKFYKNIWSNKIKPWYSSMDIESLDEYFIPEFKEFFPIPYDPKYASEWLKDSPDWLCLATFNDAGDDGWLCYNPIDKRYGIDLPDTNLSLKEILLGSLKQDESFYHLSSQQKRLVNEFKTKILSL